MSGLIVDIRIAARSLLQRRAVSLAALTCLALGIGLNLGVTSLADRLLLRPPAHVEDVENLRQVRYTLDLPGIGPVTASTFAYPTVVDLARASQVEGLAGVVRLRLPADLDPLAERLEPVEASLVSASYFSVLRVRPASGRLFSAQEVDEVAPVTVLAHRFARERFGNPQDALGKTFRVAGRELTVVGIAPAGFRGVDVAAVDLWLPATDLGWVHEAGWRTDRRAKSLRLFARAEDPVASAETLTRVYQQVSAGVSPFDQKARILLDPVERIGGRAGGKVATVLAWLAGLSTMVLLIACINVAGLLVAHALRQRKDLALRMALGASRRRALRQMLVEIVILVGAGGAGALCLMRWTQERALALLAPEALPLDRVFDLRSLAWAGVLVAAAVVVTLSAALAGFRRLKLASVLGEERRGLRARISRLLVGAQVALSMILLSGAGLFVRSLFEATSVDLGFEPNGLLVATLESGTGDGGGDLLVQLAEGLDRLPGVQSVALGAAIPLDIVVGGAVDAPGRDVPADLAGGGPYVDAVSPGYFDTLGVRLVRGRTFDTQGGSPFSALVNETAARSVWPGEDPIGKCLVIPDTGRGACRTVVGVVADTTRQTLEEGDAIQVYLPQVRGDWPQPGALFARVEPSKAGQALQTLRAELQENLPPGWLAEVRPMNELLAPELRPWRLGANIFLLFGAVGLGLAILGLVTAISQAVAAERRTIGIRMALGAGRQRLVAEVVGRSFSVVAIGATLGLAVALAGAGRLAGLLYRVSPREPSVYGVVLVVVLSAAALAAYLPARQAATADPMVALRED
jgi:predicted permease